MNLNRVWTAVVWTALATSVAHAEGNPKNGLSDESFRHNSLTVNPASVNTLVSHSLDNTLFTVPDFVLQMHDPAAQAVFTEIVRCALPATTTLTFVDPIDGTTHPFVGELGMCSGSRAWPNLACQEWVTACVASRVNALQQAIPISIRGLSTVDLGAVVAPETSRRERIGTTDPAVGQPITAFSACTPGVTDCGWQPSYVGTCATGATVKLTISGSTPTVRVCGGIHGCMQSAPVETYSPFVKQGTTPLTFTCPASLDYSVMVHTTGTPPTIVATSTGGVYPANVGEVFNFREGAFFGNMFANPSQLFETCEVPATDPAHQPVCFPANPSVCAAMGGCPDVPYTHVYACYTEGVGFDGDDRGAAYMNDRICDNPSADANCFLHRPLRCYYGNATTNQLHGSHCAWDGAVFSNCHGADGTDATIYPPVTTYLNDRCDVIGDQTICDEKTKRADDPTRTDDGDDQAGCSASSPGSSAWLVVFGVAFAYRRGRRQRN
jgi:hypothetical protein